MKCRISLGRGAPVQFHANLISQAVLAGHSEQYSGYTSIVVLHELPVLKRSFSTCAETGRAHTLPGGTRGTDGLETGIMGGARPRVKALKSTAWLEALSPSGPRARVL